MRHDHHLISLYDAHSELSMYSDRGVAETARVLGKAIAGEGLGVVARVGSPLILATLSAVHEGGMSAIGLSPAATREEHTRAFRLPLLSVPTIFTGRGGLGADVAALASSSAVLIVGSDSEALLGVLGCIGEGGPNIHILTEEPASRIRDLVRDHYPSMLRSISIAGDPAVIVKEIAADVRKERRMSTT